jgi:hypothetical protein
MEYSKKCNIELFNIQKDIGEIIGSGFKAAANGVQLTSELAKNFIEYTVLNRSTLIAVRKLEEIVHSDD